MALYEETMTKLEINKKIAELEAERERILESITKYLIEEYKAENAPASKYALHPIYRIKAEEAAILIESQQRIVNKFLEVQISANFNLCINHEKQTFILDVTLI